MRILIYVYLVPVYDARSLDTIPENYWTLPRYQDKMEEGSAVMALFTLSFYKTGEKSMAYPKYKDSLSFNIQSVILLNDPADRTNRNTDGYDDSLECINLTHTDWLKPVVD